LGLDKWIKPEEAKKKPKIKDDAKKPKKTESKPKEKKGAIGPKNLLKFNLVCPKAKCKYQKTIRKKELTEKDKICPRCKSIMKIK
jgi:acetyl-CoA carboxylase beta subunit